MKQKPMTDIAEITPDGSSTKPNRQQTIITVVCIILLLALIGIFIMAHTVPAFRAQHALPPSCAVVICERGRGRAAEQVRLVQKNMAAFNGKIVVMAYAVDGGASGAVGAAETVQMPAPFKSYAQSAVDAAAVVGGLPYVFLGDQTVPIKKLCIGDMYSATGKFRFFGGDDTDDTDAAFQMYNETIASVVVFDPNMCPVDEEYIYKLHFRQQLRHGTDMTFDVFMMRDQDMNRTQVDLAKDSGRMMATFHLPTDSTAKLKSDERAQKNTELIELMTSL
jgi:hypothetical protein